MLRSLKGQGAACGSSLQPSDKKTIAAMKGWHWLRIPTYPAGRSDKIRSVIPGYPAT
jgi:hypothetical protein